MRHDVILSWPAKHAPPPPVAPVPWSVHPANPPPANHLLQGDNLHALDALTAAPQNPATLAGLPRPKLIYIDPPYAMNVDHGVPDSPNTLAYVDSWATDSAYCQFMFMRLQRMHAWLAHDGFLFVHCDWRASAWLRLLLDECFGRPNFRNEIIWRRAPTLGRQAASRQLGRTVDSILVYSKTEAQPFPGTLPVIQRPMPARPDGTPKGALWDSQRGTFFTTAPRGDYSDASIARLRAQGRVHDAPAPKGSPKTRGNTYIKYFLTRRADGVWVKPVPLDTVWDDEGVRPVRHASKRELSVRYVTQKPVALLSRIICWATAPGDVVADLFCGSGTTGVAAHACNRPFILCDQSDAAIAATTKRLCEAGAAWNLWQPPAMPSADVQPAPPSARKPRITRSKNTQVP